MYLVAGLGVTGQSVLRYFERIGEPCLAFDTRDDFDTQRLKRDFLTVTFATGKIPENWHNKITKLVLSPGIAKSEPWVTELVAQGVEVLGDIELFARIVTKPVIAITGSNGKSTVTTLVGEVLNASGLKAGVGGNIGLAALDLLAEDQPDYDVLVLELSSFQLETTYSLKSTAATVLNISEDHMDRYSGMDEYLQTKMTIFNGAELAVFSKHKPPLKDTQKTIHFGLSSSQCGIQEYQNKKWLMQDNKNIVLVSDMALQGEHHYLNALATIALCTPFNITPENFKQAFAKFKGLPHRTQLVLEKSGVKWVNDSKGTNVGATITAIESIGKELQNNKEGKIILIVGGDGKNADFSDLTPAVANYVKHTVLFGQDRLKISQHLPKKSVSKVESLQEAIIIIQAKLLAKKGDVVLFSPACASFDQFTNYIVRGEKFEKLVQEFS